MSRSYEPPHPLFGCYLKGQRAEEHFVTYKQAVQVFMRRKPYTIAHKFESEFDHHVARLKIRERPPPALSPIIGDYIHNARSILDHLAWQLVIRAGNNPEDGRPQFPIFTKDPFDPTVYTKRGRNAKRTWESNTKGMDPRDVAFIKKLQPYNGPNTSDDHPLARLNVLSNWDKHRELHFATQGMVGSGWRVKATNAKVNLLYFLPERKILEDGAILARFEIVSQTPERKVHVNINVHCDIAFGEGSPLEGLGVQQTLFDIGQYVDDIVSRFRIKFDHEMF
jgi:hypothetical protein